MVRTVYCQVLQGELKAAVAEKANCQKKFEDTEAENARLREERERFAKAKQEAEQEMKRAQLKLKDVQKLKEKHEADAREALESFMPPTPLADIKPQSPPDLARLRELRQNYGALRSSLAATEDPSASSAVNQNDIPTHATFHFGAAEQSQQFETLNDQRQQRASLEEQQSVDYQQLMSHSAVWREAHGVEPNASEDLTEQESLNLHERIQREGPPADEEQPKTGNITELRSSTGSAGPSQEDAATQVYYGAASAGESADGPKRSVTPPLFADQGTGVLSSVLYENQSGTPHQLLNRSHDSGGHLDESTYSIIGRCSLTSAKQRMSLGGVLDESALRVPSGADVNQAWQRLSTGCVDERSARNSVASGVLDETMTLTGTHPRTSLNPTPRSGAFVDESASVSRAASLAASVARSSVASVGGASAQQNNTAQHPPKEASIQSTMAELADHMARVAALGGGGVPAIEPPAAAEVGAVAPPEEASTASVLERNSAAPGGDLTTRSRSGSAGGSAGPMPHTKLKQLLADMHESSNAMLNASQGSNGGENAAAAEEFLSRLEQNDAAGADDVDNVAENNIPAGAPTGDQNAEDAKIESAAQLMTNILTQLDAEEEDGEVATNQTADFGDVNASSASGTNLGHAGSGGGEPAMQLMDDASPFMLAEDSPGAQEEAPSFVAPLGPLAGDSPIRNLENLEGAHSEIRATSSATSSAAGSARVIEVTPGLVTMVAKGSVRAVASKASSPSATPAGSFVSGGGSVGSVVGASAAGERPQAGLARQSALPAEAAADEGEGPPRKKRRHRSTRNDDLFYGRPNRVVVELLRGMDLRL